MPGQLRPSTLDCYRHHATTYLVPHLGGTALSALTVAQVQDMFTTIAACGDRGSPVTANPLHRLRATLRQALNIAIRDQLHSTNPAPDGGATPPGPAPAPTVDGQPDCRLA